MYLFKDYITPPELTGYAREALADQPQNQSPLGAWLPYRAVDDLEYRFTRGMSGLVEAGEFRAYDAESPIGKRQGLERVSGQLPPVSRKVRLGEYDRLRSRNASNDSVRTEILNDTRTMVNAVAARVELAKGDALVNGSVTISENGVVASVDYGRAGGHSVTAGTPWSTIASATPLADMITWRDTFIASNGVPPGAGLMSSTVLGYLLRNAEIRAMSASMAGTPSLVTQSGLSALFEAHGLPPFHVVDARVSVNGSATRLIPANVFLYLPAPVGFDDFQGTALGATFWGTTAESLEPDFALADSERPGIVAGSYRTDDPVAIWTKAAGIALPVLANPNLSFKAVVAA